MNPHIKTIIAMVIAGSIIGAYHLIDNYYPNIISIIGKYFGLFFIGVIMYAFVYLMVNGDNDNFNSRPKR